LKLDDFTRDLPRTKPLYLEDAYLTTFDATVLRAELEAKRNVYLALDATAFHPKSGGQPSDTGVLTSLGFKVSVKKSIVLHDVIVHFGVAEGSLTALVSGTIDWGFRYLYMRRHTGGHLLDHCLGTTTGTNVETTDSWLGEECYVAYRGRAPSERAIAQAFEMENEIIPKGGAVRIEEISREELFQRGAERAKPAKSSHSGEVSDRNDRRLLTHPLRRNASTKHQRDWKNKTQRS